MYAWRVLSPDLPQPVDVRVVQPEDRIEPSGVRIGHQARLVLRQPAADEAVHPVVRLRLDISMHLAAVAEAGIDAAEARAAAVRSARKVRIAERGHVDLIDR